MGSQLHPRLFEWLDDGLTSGQFKVPGGRHVILNEFPRLIKESRLLGSAGVDPWSLREFFASINPDVVTISDGTPDGLRRQLEREKTCLPALRKALVPVLPSHRFECWFVYTPPLAVMRQGWRDLRSKLGDPALRRVGDISHSDAAPDGQSRALS